MPTQTPAISEKRLLKEKDISQQYNLSLPFLRNARWKGTGGPPFCKIGSMVYYRPEDVEAWVEERITTTTGRRQG